ncbi:MAG: hypothetical protein K8I03_05285 [Ignavibacteria bacterium]|nr:hypothetical protein [Ignavibacteria bacterium]
MSTKSRSLHSDIQESVGSIGSFSIESDINANFSTNDVCHYTPHFINIKSMLQDAVTNERGLYGIFITPILEKGVDEGDIVAFRMIFTNCNSYYYTDWLNNHRPYIHLRGNLETLDSVKVPVYNGGTYLYDYDDKGNTVTVHSRMNVGTAAPNFKRVKYHFDGFGNIKEKDMYKTTSTFDKYTYLFNFLNMPSKNADGTGDTTYFSYDFLGRQIKTKNADNSSSTNGYTYQTSLANFMGEGNLSASYIKKQEFTDETERKFKKYYDAAGNLLREEKFVAGEESGVNSVEIPYNQDSLYETETTPTYISLNTDYSYDNLYRLIEVLTPQGRRIKYYYDNFGRQSQRITPDAGKTNYGYDINGNLITSQDENQRSLSTSNFNLCTKRTYDGLNRLLTIGDVKIPIPGVHETGPMGDTILPVFDYISASADSLYIINVYDSIANTQYGSVFSSLPVGYNVENYTRGKLVATAYRTYLNDNWSYKYYRYDSRGNVVKYWQKLAGMDSSKVLEYYYNDQGQPLNMYFQSGRVDWKFYKNVYDAAGRLRESGLQAYLGNSGNINSENQEAPVDEEDITDGPNGGNWSYKPYVRYSYNADQQVDSLTLNVSISPNLYRHTYTNRNWLHNFFRAGGGSQFNYSMDYNPNGNIKGLLAQGSYNTNFSSTGGIQLNYVYDNSNRLVKADNPADNSFDNITSYDKDGNFQVLKRYGSSNNLEDNFSYSYYSNTNKLQKVSGSNTQYVYDANGNLKVDSLNHNYNMRYDWSTTRLVERNLLTHIWHWDFKTGGRIGDPVRYNVFMSQYWYDEAGNRIRKEKYQWILTGGSPDLEYTGQAEPVGEEESGSWVLVEATNYIRDIAGREIAIYSSNTLQQWNMYGLDNVGNIKANGDKLYYLKDHLGTVRVVLDTINTIVAGYDYDPWGYPLSNRTYEASSSIDQKYKFNSKQRDKESGVNGNNGYDYFGARYYDSRIGRWGGVEPLLTINLDISTYAYCRNNPIIFRDLHGLKEYYYLDGSLAPIVYNTPGEDVYYYEHENGNWEVTEATGIFKILKGKTFFKGNSSSTGRMYKDEKLGKGRRYYSADIVEDFLIIGMKEIIDATSKKKYLSIIEIMELSKEKQAFDFKRHLDVALLYLFGNLVYNQQEAGNILWGMTISFYDVPFWEAKIGANLYKIAKDQQVDEPNEEVSYERGYNYFKQNPFIKR